MSTAAIAAAVRRAERKLIEHLRGAGALDPARTSPLPQLRRIEETRLRRLMGSGAIRETEPGRYYLDEAAYTAYRGRRKVFVATLLVTVGIAGLAVAWWNLRG